MDENEEFVRYARWAVIENIATLAAVILGCWLVSDWCALLLFNMNSIRIKKKP